MWPTLLVGLRNPGSPRPHAQSHTRRRTPLRRAPGRLLVEQLEDRTVPSYLVTTPLDVVAPNDGVLSLREAVQAANATPGADVIDFAPGLPGTIALSGGQLTVTDDLTINGPGADVIAVSGNNASRVFDISPGAAVTIEGLTITGGLALDGGGIFNSGTLTLNNASISGNGNGWSTAEGGGIFNDGTLTLNNSTVSNNDADDGGGIFNGGTLTLNNSTVSGNRTWFGVGGGIYNAVGATATVENSTLSGNSTYNWGGGIYNSGTLTVANSTLSGNSAFAGGGIANGGGTATVGNTIVAGNSAPSGPDVSGAFSSLGYNLIGISGGATGFNAVGDQVGTVGSPIDPLLGRLQDNGGPTQTMALLLGSPAIDAGDNTDAPLYDQRGPGFPRIVNGIIDIGAFEVVTPQPPASQATSFVVSGFPSPTTAGTAGNFTITATMANGTTATGYAGTVQFTSSDAQAGLPADYTFTTADQGVHTFSAILKTAGTQSLTATDLANTSVTGMQAGITVNPAAASRLVLSAPASVKTNASFSLTVTVVDAYGNVVTGYRGTLAFSSSDRTANLPNKYTFTAADQGRHTFTNLRLKKKGTQTITVTDTLDSLVTGSVSIDVL